MSIENIVKYFALKGLDLTATGDIINKEWLEKVKPELIEEKRSYYYLLANKKQFLFYKSKGKIQKECII